MSKRMDIIYSADKTIRENLQDSNTGTIRREMFKTLKKIMDRLRGKRNGQQTIRHQ